MLITIDAAIRLSAKINHFCPNILRSFPIGEIEEDARIGRVGGKRQQRALDTYIVNTRVFTLWIRFVFWNVSTSKKYVHRISGKFSHLEKNWLSILLPEGLRSSSGHLYPHHHLDFHRLLQFMDHPGSTLERGSHYSLPVSQSIRGHSARHSRRNRNTILSSHNHLFHYTIENLQKRLEPQATVICLRK